jgi:FAD/FMN-containing dehydrogenase
VDNVIQFSVVTADGEALSVNSYQHPDLFWALRGGGGGTYAIVTSTVYRTYDTSRMASVSISATDLSRDAARGVHSQLVGILANLSDMGWSGYGYLAPNGLTVTLFAQGLTKEEANTVLQPFLKLVGDGTAGGQPPEITSASYESFYDWFLSAFPPETDDSGAARFELGSRFLYREMATRNPDKVADILIALPNRTRIK